MDLLILEFLLTLFVILYMSQIVFLLFGTRKEKNNRNESYKPFVSVIIAAKNEAENLPACLSSLANQTYNTEKYEIILVDDLSSDHTLEIAKLFQKKVHNLKCYQASENPKRLTSKANAIALAIRKSKGAVLLFTDADCQVPRDWISEYVKYFKKNVGLVSGLTCMEISSKICDIWDKIQCLDWIYLLSIGVSAARNGIALSCVGNNFGVRRDVYEEIGGHQEIGFSLTEDSALLNTIQKKTKWKLLFTFNKKLIVLSRPLKNLVELFHQRKRWASGSTNVRNYGKFLIIIGGMSHILIPFSIIFIDKNIVFWALLSLILFFDFIFLLRVTHLIDNKRLLLYFLFFEIYYFMYTSILAFALIINRKIVWKGVVYNLDKKDNVCIETKQ